MICTPDPAAQVVVRQRQQCRGPRDMRLRALVCLRDGLTADSTRRTVPELKRAAEVFDHPDDPTIHQAPEGPAMAKNPDITGRRVSPMGHIGE